MNNSLSKNFENKKKLVENLSSVKTDSLDHVFNLNIHDVPLEFHCASEELVKMIFEHYPIRWLHQKQKPQFKVKWTDISNYGWSPQDWENEPSFDCQTLTILGKTVALHRDFLAVVSDDEIQLITPYSLSDGFFNFLRWLVPLYFIDDHKILLHSSCVVGPGHKAYFCLGPSGAGKSTIASLAPRSKILGDDMNVLKWIDGKCWAQAGALGQAIASPKEYNNWYEVGGFFWLKKSSFFQMETMTKAFFARCLYQSVANVFWGQIHQDKIAKITAMVYSVVESNELRELKFPIDPDLWPQIFLKMSQNFIKENRNVQDTDL